MGLRSSKFSLSVSFAAVLCCVSLAFSWAYVFAQLSNKASPSSIRPSTNNLPFAAGESYFFVVTYAGFSVGRASLQVIGEDDFNGRKVLHFINTARTNRFFDLFYKLRNRVESLWDEQAHYSLYYSTYQEEVDDIRTKEIRFYPEKELVIYKRGDVEERLNLSKRVQDTLSAFYFLRTMSLDERNSPIIIETFDSRRLWQIKVFVVGREVVEVPAGVFNTIIVKPELDYEGIFKHTGDIYIWLTDDQKRMPIKVKSKITVGSFEALLERYEPK